MKILISGGHLTPALACIEYIRAQHPQDKIVFVGRKYSQDKLKQLAVEFQEVSKHQVDFIFFNAPKFELAGFMDILPKIWQLVNSLWQAWQIFNQQQPTVFLSFGGYLAVPLALVAKLKRVPIITHEQTMVIGKANQLLVKLADKVAVSFEQTLAQVPNKNKAVLTGNPLRKAVFLAGRQASWFNGSGQKPILLVMGGNQGSLVLNNFIKNNLISLCQHYTIVHQCGRDNANNQYQLELLSSAKQQLGEKQTSYYPVAWLDETELAWFYKQAHLALSRAGANTLFELVQAQLPMILVPLAKANLDEQHKNAQWAVDHGFAQLIDQEKLNIDFFWQKSAIIKQNYSAFKKALVRFNANTDAPAKIYQLIESILK